MKLGKESAFRYHFKKSCVRSSLSRRENICIPPEVSVRLGTELTFEINAVFLSTWVYSHVPWITVHSCLTSKRSKGHNVWFCFKSIKFNIQLRPISLKKVGKNSCFGVSWFSYAHQFTHQPLQFSERLTHCLLILHSSCMIINSLIHQERWFWTNVFIEYLKIWQWSRALFGYETV